MEAIPTKTVFSLKPHESHKNSSLKIPGLFLPQPERTFPCDKKSQKKCKRTNAWLMVLQYL
jgi:hypothetical protein